MNKVILIGRLVSDPESYTTSTGKKIARFSLAVNDLRNNKESHFFNCSAWNQQSEYAISYLKKGSLIAADGRLLQNRYTNKEGKSVSTIDVVIDAIKSIPIRGMDAPSQPLKEEQIDNIANSRNRYEDSVDDEKKQVDKNYIDENEPLEWMKELE